MMLEICLLAVAGLYAAEYAILSIGRRRSSTLPRRVDNVLPSITILVAARNEESNIERCVRGLLAQVYPQDQLEIIVVDDESDDGTPEILERLCAESTGRLRVYRTSAERSHARGKARAIAQGVDMSSGEIVLLTDADCIPPPHWARGIVSYFTEHIDALGSFTIVRSHDLFSRIQMLDWFHLQSLACSAMGLGYPIGVLGNNMAFRRTAYNAVGGYRSIAFSVTEDFELFRAIYKAGGGLRFPCDSDTVMWTLPCASIAEVVRQKQRWARGGTSHLFPGTIVLLLAVAMLGAFCAAPFVSQTAWLMVWGAKFAADAVLMFPVMRRLGFAGDIRNFLLFEFYFLAQAIVIPLFLARRTVVWKGRSYHS